MADREDEKRNRTDDMVRGGSDEQIRGIANDEEDFDDTEDLDEEEENEEGSF